MSSAIAEYVQQVIHALQQTTPVVRRKTCIGHTWVLQKQDCRVEVQLQWRFDRRYRSSQRTRYTVLVTIKPADSSVSDTVLQVLHASQPDTLRAEPTRCNWQVRASNQTNVENSVLQAVAGILYTLTHNNMFCICM